MRFKIMWGMTLMSFVAGCQNVASVEVCQGTEAATTAHAAALARDGGPESLDTGALLVKLLDAGCGR
jgi:hypothetical protein